MLTEICHPPAPSPAFTSFTVSYCPQPRSKFVYMVFKYPTLWRVSFICIRSACTASYLVHQALGVSTALALKLLTATWERWVYEQTQKTRCGTCDVPPADSQMLLCRWRNLIRCTYMIPEDHWSGLRKRMKKAAGYKKLCSHIALPPKMSWVLRCKTRRERGLLKRKSMGGHGRPSPRACC